MKIKHIILAAVAAAGLTSCNDAVHKDTDVTGPGRLFINEAVGTSKVTSFVIPDAGMTVAVTPRISKPLPYDIEVTVYVNEEGLEEYNQRNSTTYILMDEANYEFEAKTTIPAGKVIASPVAVKLHALTMEQNKTGFVYALPMAVKASGSDVAVLDNADTFLLAANPVPFADVPELTKDCIIRMELAEDYLLSSWTFELLFNASGFPSGNSTSWMASAIGYYAQEGKYLIQDGFMWRLGDSGGGTPSNIINGMISRSGKKTSEIALDPKLWYHIAVVCDEGAITLYINGNVGYTGASGYPATQFYAKQGIRLAGENRQASSIGSNYYRFSQVRFWGVARTLPQLNNNRYAVATDSPGLLGYWKLSNPVAGKAMVPSLGSTGLIEESTSMMEIDTFLFKDETGKQPDAHVDKTAAATFKFSTDKRIEVGYDWDGNKVQ